MFGGEPYNAARQPATSTRVQVDDGMELLTHHIDKRP